MAGIFVFRLWDSCAQPRYGSETPYKYIEIWLIALASQPTSPIQHMQRYPTFHRFNSIDSSTTETASNRTGAGRALGNLYSRGGRSLEAAIGRVAHKLGFGPSAVALRVKKKIMSHGLDSCTEQDEKSDFQQIQDRSVLKLCKKLVKYMR